MLVAVGAAAAAVAAPHETMIAREDWRPQRRAPVAAPHTLLFVARERNVGAALTEELMAVSDPESSRYGDHLTFEEVGALTSDPAATRCVHDYQWSICYRDASLPLNSARW